MISRKTAITLITEVANLRQLIQTHTQTIVNGIQSDVVTVTKLTQRYSDLSSIRHASLLCNTFKKPDIFLYNVLIRAFSRSGKGLSAVECYLKVRKETTLKPDNFTYAFLVSALNDGVGERVGLLIYAHSIVDGYGSDVFVGSAVVDWCFKIGRVGVALKVFDGMPERDTVLWNTVISGLLRCCEYGGASRMFLDMLRGGAVVNEATVVVVLPAVAELKEIGFGMAVQCLAIKIGVDRNGHVVTGLVLLYSKCGYLETAEWLFKRMWRPDVVAYNAMLSGYAWNHDTESAVRLFKEVQHMGGRVEPSSIVALIPVHSAFGHLDLTFSIHAFSVKHGMVSYPTVSTALTTVYSRLNEIEQARKLFDECAEKSLAVWNAMISGYTQNGLKEEAISLFQQMQKLDIRPNHVTASSMLSACAQLGDSTLGNWVHDVMIKEKLDLNVYSSTALIDMYAKCGSVLYAREIFDAMPNKNIVTWNAMISGYGLHGHGREALALFHELSAAGVQLTGATFICTMHACSHAGLVEEGKEVFRSMVHDFGFKPSSEHYACMVDILGRAGQLNKAIEFIASMPFEPDPAVWKTMLGACMIHKDKRLEQIALDKLLSLGPQDIGNYVLLSNIYASEGSYDEAASVRQVAREQKLAKIPGCTLIEISAEVPCH